MVFVSFGILLFLPENLSAANWNLWFIVITLIMCFVSRACNTFFLSFFLNLGRKQKIPFKCQVIMWYCGMRGIITLLLVLNFRTPNRSVLINTTFAIIFFTNFAIGFVPSFFFSLHQYLLMLTLVSPNLAQTHDETSCESFPCWCK